jgi:ureidoglycolate lyase
MTTALPLNSAAFAPFGEVLEAPTEGRVYFEKALRTARPGARPSLSIVRSAAAPTGSILARQMERHEFSSQSFIPMGPARFLVLIAPHAPQGGPDMTKARAFVAEPGQGVTYGADVWHHGLTVLGQAASFGVFMWNDGTERDVEFLTLPEPFPVHVP